MEEEEVFWLDSESWKTAIEGSEEEASWFDSDSWETAIEGEAEGSSQLEEQNVHGPGDEIMTLEEPEDEEFFSAYQEEATSPENPEQEASESSRRVVKSSEAILFEWCICIPGGLTIGYLSAGIGGVLAIDLFMKKLSARLFHQMTHAQGNNYCGFFSIYIQLVIASAYFLTAISILIGPRFSVRWGSRRILAASTFFLLLGIALMTWFPITPILILGFLIRSIGTGLTHQAILIVRTQIAPQSKKFDVCQLLGSLLAPLINLIAALYIPPSISWRLMVGDVGLVALFLFAASVLFWLINSSGRNTSQAEEISYKTLFLSKKARPALSIFLFSASLTTFSAIDAINSYGPLMFTSLGLSVAESYLPPLLSSFIQVLFGLACIKLPQISGRRKLLIITATIKLISEGVLAGYFYKTSHYFKYYRSPMLFILTGTVYVIAQAIVGEPKVWLRVMFPRESTDAGSLFGAALGHIQSGITAFISVPLLCKLNKNIFFPYMIWDIVTILVIAFFVPETANVDDSEVVGVWNRHWWWKKYVRVDDTY